MGLADVANARGTPRENVMYARTSKLAAIIEAVAAAPQRPQTSAYSSRPTQIAF